MLVDGISGLESEDRLKALNLFPQEYRRGDFITLRMILREDYGPELQQFCHREKTPGGVVTTSSRRRDRVGDYLEGLDYCIELSISGNPGLLVW